MKTRLTRALDVTERLLERWEVRLVLASLIVVSILPLPETRALDLIIFPIFAIELGVRIAIIRRSKGLKRTEIAILVADSLALISFLPIQHLIGGQALRLLRLARLVMLGRFLRTVVLDLRRILSQRQLRQQLGFLAAAVVLLTFLGGTVLTNFNVPVEDFNHDGRTTADEGNLGAVLWWVFRQVEDPGNLVEDADSDPLLLLTSLVFTVAGVFVMSFIIGIGSSVVGALMLAGRRRPVGYRNHTVVIGGGRNVREVLEDLLEMYEKNRRRARIALLGDGETPPAYVDEPSFRPVAFRTGEPTSLGAHELLSTEDARRVIVLSNDELGESADAYAVSSVLAARQKNPTCPVIVEMHHRRNIDVARVAGGQNVNPVPMGKFLGSLMSQNMMFPGIDHVFEELLTARGSEIYTHIYSPADLQSLKECENAILDFRTLLHHIYRDNRAVLLGVLLGEDEWTYDVGELTIWLNPLDEAPETARALGAETGVIPLQTLRGFVAIAPEYITVRKAAQVILRHLQSGDLPRAECKQTTSFGTRLTGEMLELRRVLILGDNELLPAMVENTADFVEELELFIVSPSVERQKQLAAEFRRRGRVLSQEEHGAFSFELAQGARATVIGSTDDLLADALDHPLLGDAPLDVVVVLSDPQEVDPDAHSALVLLRLLEFLRDDRLDISPRFRVLAEVLSGPKGQLLQQRLTHDSDLPFRIVSTQKTRAYFLVHCAYVPGSEQIHLELLTQYEQDFCQLRLEHSDDDEEGEGDREMSFADLLEELSCQTPPVIPFGVMLGANHPSPGLVLNPNPADTRVRFRPSQVEAVYAVGETVRFTTKSQ